jgi:uracil-DNA glycosylase family 4
MSASAQRRRQYLAALGIEEWRSRACADEAGDAVAAGVTAPAVPVAPAAPAVVAPPDVAVPAVAADWGGLVGQVRDCVRCALRAGCTQTVFGVGDRNAKWLVVGEAPGAEEDRQGEPFVGRAGQLLNSMLLAIDQPRERVFIANVNKCRPPGNRDPRPEEVAACLPYLHRQIELIKPRIMLAVGRIAAQNLLATDTPIGKLRGKVHRFGAAGTPLVITYHPAYLLRSPGEKRKAWEDLKFARNVFRRIEAGEPVV